MSWLEKWFPSVERIMLAVLFATALHAQWRLVAEHGVPVPFHDQWTAEGEAIFEPWFAGNLGASDFWKPSNEHRPVLTRLLAFAEFRLTGRWDTRLQMLVNGFFHASTALALALLARRLFSRAGRLVAIAGLGVFFGMAGSYENAVWGYQSQFYLMVMLGVLHLGGTFTTSRVGATWIAAQIAGALGLLAMAGGLLAPLAAAGIAAARLTRGRDTHTVATLGAAAALVLAGFWMLPEMNGGGPLHAQSAIQFVEVSLKLLAWPSPLVLAAALMHLPWLIVAVRTLAAREARPADLALTALGGWVLLQALAIAYSRGGSFSVIPPRYTDILSVGLVVNAGCLYSTWRGGFRPPSMWMIAMAWQVFMIFGFSGFDIRTFKTGRERLETIIEANEDLYRRTLGVVRDYLRTGDPAALKRDAFVAHHFPSIATMRRLLDNPGIRASLPPEVRGEETPPPFAQLAALALGSWKWPGYASSALFSAALLFAILLARIGKAPCLLPPVPWFAVASVATALALALVVAGMQPWDTDPRRRLERILDAAGPPAAGFEIAGAAGGIYVTPETPAAFLHGTLIGGDAMFMSELRSTEFALDRRFVLVPVTGYPVLEGNSLRLETLAPDGSVARVFNYTGASPRERIGVWSIAAEAAPGTRARLVLVDGTGGHGGWLGVGTPRLTDDATSARRLEVALETVSAESARRFPAVLFAAAVYCAAAGVIERRSSKRGGLASAATH